jgi:hypothetical protein
MLQSRVLHKLLVLLVRQGRTLHVIGCVRADCHVLLSCQLEVQFMIGLLAWHGLPPSKLCKEHVKRHPRQRWEKHPLW